MSDGTSQPPDQPTRRRATQGTRRTGRKRSQQATPAPSPVQEASAPLAAVDTTGSIAPQALPAANTSPPPAPDEPPIGERWGEFPTKERQAELAQRLQAWEQEPDHNGHAGPFVGAMLTGADVYWLAARVAKGGDVAAGRIILYQHNANVDLSTLHLEGANLEGANLEGGTFSRANLQGANLRDAHLQQAEFYHAQLQGADLIGAQLQGARFQQAQLQEASLSWACLQGAILHGAKLEHASFNGAHLEGANLNSSDLRGVNFYQATLDAKTILLNPLLNDKIQVADVRWDGVLLTRVDWEMVQRLGDETYANQAGFISPNPEHNLPKKPDQRLMGYQAAARAYRQLAIALRGQGITDAADRFTYRQLIMQRKAVWWQVRTRKIGKLGSYLFSLFLAVLTGYGYRMSRIVVAYLLLISGFASAYWSVGVNHPRDISFWTALIVSVTAFHGRVFTNPFAPNIPDAQVVITAIEAIVGLVMEGVFIAMLTQRFFNR